MEEKVVLKNEKGESVTCNLVAMFSFAGKNYIVYEYNDDVMASLYKIENDTINIFAITDNKDYDIVDNYLEAL